MCLAIPALIVESSADRSAMVDMLGVRRKVALDLTPQAVIGDYVLVHAGFAIQVVSAEEAEETLKLIREFPELAPYDG